MDDPEFVDAFQGFTVADEQWALRQFRNGDGPHEDAVDDSWTPRNLADLDDVPPVQPTLGGLGLVYPGKRHVFSGPQESAKTLAAYIVGLQVVREGQKVVLIDFEMGPWDAKQRLRELGATGDELGGFLYVEPDTPASAAHVGGLSSLEPALVIVDAVAGAFQLESYDDNSRRDVERWAAGWVTPFWKAGIATIVLDHVTKNAETRGNYAIGSERKVGGADVHLGFSVITAIRRGGQGKYQVTTHKDRGGHLKRGKLATFELVSDPDSHMIEWEFVEAPLVDDEHPFRPTILMHNVSRWLLKQFEPVPMSHIENGVQGNREAKREAIEILVTEGYIAESEGARGARMMLLSRAYDPDNDLSLTSPDLSQLDTQTTSPLDSAPHGAGQPGEVSPGIGEVSSPDDGIPF